LVNLLEGTAERLLDKILCGGDVTGQRQRVTRKSGDQSFYFIVKTCVEDSSS